MTGQTLLDYMELLNQELQLQPAESDVTRGLLALNIAQDYFESLAAVRGKVLGTKTGTLTTSANTETTAFPTGVLRIDNIDRLSPSTNRPEFELRTIKKSGGHLVPDRWPFYLLTTTGSGKPTAYWTDGTSIYWSPLPDAIYTLRWYGFQAATDITASGTFLYPDAVAFPIATFATKVLKIGLEDPTTDLSALATEVFTAVLNTLAGFQKDGATPWEYTQHHTE